jgi:hypothetical protein
MAHDIPVIPAAGLQQGGLQGALQNQAYAGVARDFLPPLACRI